MKNHFKATIASTVFATLFLLIYPAEAAYLVGTSCKYANSTITDPLNNSLTCTKIGKIQVWRSKANPFILRHATQGIAYKESIRAHFIPSSVSLRTPFTYSFGSKIVSPHIGLTVGKDGNLQFTPTEIGAGKFQICLTDAKRKKLCKNFSLTTDRLVTTLVRNGANSYILRYPTQGKSYRYWWTEDFTGGPYTYYLVESDIESLLGLAMEPDGVLIITANGTTTRKFQVCGKDASGSKLCKIFTISVDYLLPEASPTNTPTRAPSNISGITGKWEGKATLFENGPPKTFWAGCAVEVLHQLDFKQDGEKLTGTLSLTFVRYVSPCGPDISFPSAGIVYSSHALSGSILNGKGKFSVVIPPTPTGIGSARDYEFSLTGNELDIAITYCHSPDPRCEGTIQRDGIGLSGSTEWWYTGNLIAVRKS